MAVAVAGRGQRGPEPTPEPGSAGRQGRELVRLATQQSTIAAPPERDVNRAGVRRRSPACRSPATPARSPSASGSRRSVSSRQPTASSAGWPEPRQRTGQRVTEREPRRRWARALASRSTASPSAPISRASTSCAPPHHLGAALASVDHVPDQVPESTVET